MSTNPKQCFIKNTWFGFAHSGGPEGDRTLEPHGCEPNALQTELRARIFAVFRNFFVNLDFLLGAVISALLSRPLALPTEL